MKEMTLEQTKKMLAKDWKMNVEDIELIDTGSRYISRCFEITTRVFHGRDSIENHLEARIRNKDTGHRFAFVNTITLEKSRYVKAKTALKNIDKYFANGRGGYMLYDYGVHC